MDVLISNLCGVYQSWMSACLNVKFVLECTDRRLKCKPLPWLRCEVPWAVLLYSSIDFLVDLLTNVMTIIPCLLLLIASVNDIMLLL